MNDKRQTSSPMRSIAAVERDTGLSKDTLRVWERRYGFPAPGRDEHGERAYSTEQIEKLRVLRRLLDAGHRPGKLVELPIEQLNALAAEAAAPAAAAAGSADREPNGNGAGDAESLSRFLDLIKAHRIDELRRTLSEAQLRVGIERFVLQVVAPLTRLVGDAWARGDVEIFEEHLYTESMQVVLRSAIATIPQPVRRPRVLLTTIPQEPHGLGLLMSEAILSLEGCRCVSLGVRTPVWDIVLAASANDADVVGLSFSGILNPNQVLESLDELRQKLPARVEIWAGGSSLVLRRRPPSGVVVPPGLDDIQPAIARWRAVHSDD
jgi:MerR family transcriptional regulator, light-induced transcriptional regulator